jgi:predicted nucleic acid-binding protein
MSALVKVQIVIKDACILFDLIDLKLLASFYNLNLVVMTTPQVLSEITDETQMAEIDQYIQNGQLKIDHFDSLEAIVEIVDNNPGLSFTDASVLELANRIDATILSSDKSLRNESQRRGIVVRGMLWILEELYIQKIVELELLLEKLKQYPTINKRAPKTEIENLKKKYSS